MKISHPSWAEVDLDRLHGNVDAIARAAGVPLIPVIKANAYGHGAVAVARELARRTEVAALAVGVVEEAAELRAAGIKGRIIVLDGVFPEQAARAVALNVEAVVSTMEEARGLAARAGKGRVALHVKVNTGMTRLGAAPEEAVALYEKIARLKRAKIAGVMTHFADSGSAEGQFTNRQLDRFDEILGALRARGHNLPPIHAANTAALFLSPRARYDMVRPGIGLYGIQEFDGRDAELKPILSWKARIILTRKVGKGESVSYGMRWKSPGVREVAVVMAGYADGYSRQLSGKARAIMGGRLIRQIGTICMDNCMFDITGRAARAGDAVTLIGREERARVTAAELARECGTIAYEVLCGLGRRVVRVYFSNGRRRE